VTSVATNVVASNSIGPYGKQCLLTWLFWSVSYVNSVHMDSATRVLRSRYRADPFDRVPVLGDPSCFLVCTLCTWNLSSEHMEFSTPVAALKVPRGPIQL